MLPCKHEARVTGQVQPTIDLLSNMDGLHPDVLLAHEIQPEDYKGGLVFRSAVESIRGTFIASSTTGREGMVKGVLEKMLERNCIKAFKQSSGKARYDFTVKVTDNPDYNVALEVKGGEGNSINISERPLWANEFAVWRHLDGAIVNQPAHGAHSIINRLTNEMVRRKKSVDVLFFKDILCGTRTRPCPKYPGKEETIGLSGAPDVFLLPQRIPSINDPEPPTHTMESLRLPRLLLASFGLGEAEEGTHTWRVFVKLNRLDSGSLQREILVEHQGEIIDVSKSRPWKES